MSINGPDPEMTLVDIPERFLQHIYIGSCSYINLKNFGCSSPEGLITDFNIWDKFLSTKELEDWTTCKLVGSVSSKEIKHEKI